MFQPKTNKGNVAVYVIISLVFIAWACLIFFYKQTIIDQLTVWQFKPSTEISTIAVRDELSYYGKFLLYASQAEIDSADVFNSVCKRIENTTSILGCYSDSRIYIYNITDTTLDGIREVTAAHEMLHAAYSRMSDSEKAKINVLLEAEYEKLKDNKEFSDLIAFYARTEPGERDNELHSVIGTEIGTIDPDLEAHYHKYFSNRQAVVDFYKKYSGIFKTLAERAAVISSRLAELSTSIVDNSTQYNSDVQVLNSDIIAFNVRAAASDFTSQWQFNNERTAMTNRVDALNAKKTEIDNDIVKYNTLLIEYNSIATQSTRLYESIDSTLVPVSSV